MTESCGTCKFWVLLPEGGLPTNYRRCERTEMEDGAPVHADTQAYAMDGEDFHAVLITFSSFYCNQWRPAQPDPVPSDWEQQHHPACHRDYESCHPRYCPGDQYRKTGKWQPWLADQEC